MNDNIWFEEQLIPDSGSITEITRGVKSSNQSAQLAAIRRQIRLHQPRWRKLDAASQSKLAVSSPSQKYTLIRLGCEFDPSDEKRASFVSVQVSVFLWGEGSINPRVYGMMPVELNSGKPGSVKLKLEPSIELEKVGKASLGGIETDIEFGQVAPVVRGFFGEEERQPYWKLEHHREAPIYGLRHFWLLIETPLNLPQCYIGCRVEGYLQTSMGRLLLMPEAREWIHRPKMMIPLV